MKIHGTKYQEGAVIRVCVDQVSMVYCQLQDIYIHSNYKIFRTAELDVLQYEEGLRAIQIDFTDKTLICTYDDLATHTIFHVKSLNKHNYIIDSEAWLHNYS